MLLDNNMEELNYFEVVFVVIFQSFAINTKCFILKIKINLYLWLIDSRITFIFEFRYQYVGYGVYLSKELIFAVILYLLTVQHWL